MHAAERRATNCVSSSRGCGVRTWRRSRRPRRPPCASLVQTRRRPTRGRPDPPPPRCRASSGAVRSAAAAGRGEARAERRPSPAQGRWKRPAVPPPAPRVPRRGAAASAERRTAGYWHRAPARRLSAICARESPRWPQRQDRTERRARRSASRVQPRWSRQRWRGRHTA
eukprot:scaffold12676_cov112-Isochrysis_galbana.AAC.6